MNDSKHVVKYIISSHVFFVRPAWAYVPMGSGSLLNFILQVVPTLNDGIISQKNLDLNHTISSLNNGNIVVKNIIT